MRTRDLTGPWLAASIVSVFACLALPAPDVAAVGPTGVTRPAVVRVAPMKGTIRVGAIVTVRILIQTDSSISSAPFSLLYDPSILEFLPGASREGRFLNRDGAATIFLAAPGSVPGGRPGIVVGLSRLGGRSSIKGKGELCELRFRAHAPGTSVLSFTRATLLDANAGTVPADFEGTSIRVRSPR